MHHHFANFYLIGYAIAVICVFLAITTVVGGEVVGRRGRNIIRKDENPALYWSNVGFLLAVAAICAGLAYWHQVARDHERQDRYDAAQFQQ
ncbi:MAG TPA: hypothetical protein VHL34_18985 [Rhizomicrobium sp.]|jgi:hypothetical protein|nr:hypothetical protein [Rhizomicrobium sp.]